MKRGVNVGMELTLFSNGWKKRPIKCMFGCFYPSIEDTLIVPNVRAQGFNMNHNSGSGKVALFQNYILYRFANSSR